MAFDLLSFLLGKSTGSGGGGGSAALGPKTIRQNGVYRASSDNLDGYNIVTVEVPNSYAAADNGKVVSNGALVAQTSRTITENGTFDTTLNDEVVVNVPSGGGGTSTDYAQGTFTLAESVLTHTIETGIDYDYLVLFQNIGDPTTSGERYLRVMTNDFTRDSGQNILTATTNNTGSSIAGFYKSNSTWGRKDGTKFIYTNQSSNTHLSAGITYRWTAWREAS